VGKLMDERVEALLADEQVLSNPILVISDIPQARRVRAALQQEVPARAAGEQWLMVRLMWKELLRVRDVSRRDYSVLSTLCGLSQVERNLRIP
jgi:hypothetical protein